MSKCCEGCPDCKGAIIDREPFKSTIVYPEVEELRHLIAEQKKEIDLLKEQLQFGVDAVNRLLELNERYRNSLIKIKSENKKSDVDFNDQARYWRDQEIKSRMIAHNALESE